MDERILEFKKNLERNNVFGIALDIDETLSNTRKYWFRILIERLGNPENLSLDELLSKYRYSQDVPYWQTTEGREIMQQNREDSSLQMEIGLMEGSLEGVLRVHEIVPVLCYISARPESVQSATEEWLAKYGFPKAEVFLKPNNISKDESYDWKSGVLNYLYPNIVGIVDDNFAQVESLHSLNCKGRVWLYGHSINLKSGFAEVCDSWDEVVTSMINNPPIS